MPAYLISGLPVHLAIGTNKLSSAMGTTVSTVKFARSGYIDWKMAIPCVALSLLGANIGAHLSLLIDDKIFKIIMLVFLPLTAIYVIFGKGLISEKTPFSFVRTLIIAMVVSLIIGIYDGFMDLEPELSFCCC